MPFQQVFERRVNRNMQEREAGPAPPKDDDDVEDVKIKDPDQKERICDDEDMEISEKKDRPPRFSTLFDHVPPPPQIVERYIEPKKRSGVTIPTPLFVLLAFVLFFESTLLFAYTIIGLYNNMPAGVLPFGGSSTASAVGGCTCDGQQAGINISPNFIMPGANVEGLTLTSDLLPILSATPTSPSPSDSTSTSAQDTTLMASKLASFLRGQAEIDSTSSTKKVVISTKVVTSTPEQKTVLSTVEQTVIPGQSTSTSFVTVEPSSSTKDKRASPASPVPSADQGKSAKEGTPSTLLTSASTKGTEGAASPTEGDGEKKATTTTGGGACFGAGGAVFLNCVTDL